MLGQGIMLMLAGTGTVFVFLILMVVVMLAVGRYYQANESRYAESAGESQSGSAQRKEADAAAVIAAIVGALQKRRG